MSITRRSWPGTRVGEELTRPRMTNLLWTTEKRNNTLYDSVSKNACSGFWRGVFFLSFVFFLWKFARDNDYHRIGVRATRCRGRKIKTSMWRNPLKKRNNIRLWQRRTRIASYPIRIIPFAPIGSGCLEKGENFAIKYSNALWIITHDNNTLYRLKIVFSRTIIDYRGFRGKNSDTYSSYRL